MDKEKFEKELKNDRLATNIILGLLLAVAIITAFSGELTSILDCVRLATTIILLVIVDIGLKNKKEYGPICAIALSIIKLVVSIITLPISISDFFAIIIYICYLADNIVVLKHMKKINQ